MCNDVDLLFQLSRQYNIIFITYLLKPGETTVFCRPSTATKHTVSLGLLHAYSKVKNMVIWNLTHAHHQQ